MSGEIFDATHDPWPCLREDWAIWDAAYDWRTLAIFELFEKYDFDQATVDLIKDSLEVQFKDNYGVPPERSNEVFEKAEALIWREMEANGEA